jgi:hypothetical protein
MLAAYRERPTIKSVMAAGGVGKRIARRAVMEGWPDLSLPPFIELMSSGTTVHKEMAVLRESWEEAAITKGEAARQAAEEAMAARLAMKSAIQSAQLAHQYAEKVLGLLNNVELSVEDVTPKLVYQLVRTMESSNATLEKAMKIEQMQMGKPEQVLGIQIGILLERCNDSELEVVVTTGELPSRILDQRKRVIEAVSEESKAEQRALLSAGTEDVLEAPQDAQDGQDEAEGYEEDPEDSDDVEGLEEPEGRLLPALAGLGA